MSTLTHTPAQSNFADRFTLNYPAGHRPDIGSVVGPNWLNEFFVVTAYEEVTEPGTEHTPKRSYTRALLELLSKDRKDLLTVQNRRDFVSMSTARQVWIFRTGVQEVPDRRGINALADAFKYEAINDMVLRLLESKRAAA
ncbi:hypothetical protein [Nocardia phage NC1]|nr:hypothetical protein [Nocardia phage NC1]QSL67760.1 hypothetical protein [Nocardia phage P69]